MLAAAACGWAALPGLPLAQVPVRSTMTARGPEILGLSLEMPLDAAVRISQGLAPQGSVTLPPRYRDPFMVVAIEAPAALAPRPPELPPDPRDSNFYLLLNNAPRYLLNQPTRSSHVGYITLVADRRTREVVRIVFEPTFVHLPDGFDGADLDAAALAALLRERLSAEVRLVTEPPRPGSRSDAGSPGRAPPVLPEPSDGRSRAARWELRVHALHRSVVLTDLKRLPDAQAARLKLE